MNRKKISIENENGSLFNVRPKDVVLLHPGPIQDLSSLKPLTGDIETAWELLAGETCNLEMLSDLAFDEFTPSSAWAAWQVVADGLYFRGNPDEISAAGPDEVAAAISARKAKEAERQAWAAFIDRVEAREVNPEDDDYIQEIIALAAGKRQSSQVLRALGTSETPENAHSLLLELGVWDVEINPYPARAGLALVDSTATLPGLPEESRRDLTHLAAFAIDDAGSQDPDDALSWDNGRIWVHIADAAALIAPGSPADKEALARGANLYLPDRTISMLPHEATEKLALGLNETSPALSFGIDTNDKGEVTNLEIMPSRVKVTRLSYEEAERHLYEAPLQDLFTVMKKYQSRRQHNGAIEIDLPEVKVRVENGIVKITPLPKLKSRELVREAMLMAGEAVALYALKNKLPIPFTLQDAPVGELPEGRSPSAMFAMRRLLKPSQKSSNPGKHHGLGLEPYAQVTSPLRRYLDLVIHQQLRAFMRGEELLNGQEITGLIGASDSIIRDVRRVERNSNRHWTCVLLLQQPDWHGEGIVVEKHGKRHVVLLPQLELGTSLYRAEDLPLDSVIQLTVNEVDLAHLEANFR